MHKHKRKGGMQVEEAVEGMSIITAGTQGWAVAEVVVEEEQQEDHQGRALEVREAITAPKLPGLGQRVCRDSIRDRDFRVEG